MKRVGAIKVATDGGGSLPSSPQSHAGDFFRNQVGGMVELLPCRYPQSLSLYNEPPLCEVTIEEFEELALSRLDGILLDYTFFLCSLVLRTVETGLIRGMKDEELGALLMKSCNQTNLVLHGNEYGERNLREVEIERRRDHLSHFILRLAFCGNPENIRWFVNYESVLLRSRFDRLTTGDKLLFITSCTGEFAVASTEEKKMVSEQLSSIHGNLDEDFFLVPWHIVPDLVSRRALYLQKGIAYVPKSEAFSIVLSRFRDGLEAQMERTAKELPSLRDERILPLLDLIKKADTKQVSAGADSSKGFIEGQLTADEVDRASVHFPLCMQNVHKNLRSNSHLKYGGRQQYGLFLKSIGLTLDEALAFWRRSFASKVGEDKFQKEYAYNVRHNYGQEGKRANYSSYNCSKIITGSAPSTGDHHGCPFKHHRRETLRSSLQNYASPNGTRLTKEHIDSIAELVTGGHYQLACTKLFELTRKTNGPIETVSWPSKFYEMSIKESQ